MADPILRLKRSSTPGKIPLTTDLQLGELAVNTYDGKAYLKKDVSGSETIVNLGGGYPGQTYYVTKTGLDTNDGQDITSAFATLKYALSVATAGDTIEVSSGVFTEVFPLTVPQGVTIRGYGLRSTFIQPTPATERNDAFLMNGETTIEDISLGNFYYNSSTDTGYGFRFAPNMVTTIRSPYVQRVTVLNKGSDQTVNDPYGYDTVDNYPTSKIAGRGVLIDASVVQPNTLSPSILFNECTFITPNQVGLKMINGARTEWVNCFTYFASVGIEGVSGNVGLASTANAQLKLSGITTDTIGENYVIKYYQSGFPVAIGTVVSTDNDYVTILGKGSGLFNSVGIGSTQDVRIFQSDGTTQVGTAATILWADYQKFGADMRSIGSATNFGTVGVRGDGKGVQLRLFGFNFGCVGSGKTFTQDPTLTIKFNEVIQTNGGRVYYQSVDQAGNFNVGTLLQISQEEGLVSIGTTSDINITGTLSLNRLETAGISTFRAQIDHFSNVFNTNQGSYNLINDNATEVNFAGDATDLSIGAETGVTTVRNYTVNLSGGQESYSPTTGTLQVDGGVGISSNLNVGKDLKISGVSTFVSDASFDSNAIVSGVTTFVGDSRIESNLDVTGIVTATAFYGEGGALTLGGAGETPTDNDLVTGGALNTFTGNTKIIDGIDELNELAFNIIRNTAVTEVDFVSTPQVGGSPLSVSLNITHSGNANRYDIDWGDGNVSLDQSLSIVGHTYIEPNGAILPITVTARNNTGVGAGHSQTLIKSDYITVYTPDPDVNFAFYSAVSGGSSISYWDDGATVYLENTTTNVTGFAVTYTIAYGDGSFDQIASNASPGGVGGGRTDHIFNNAPETDTVYTVTTTLNSHPAADPAVIPTSETQTFKVYSTHTPSFTTPYVNIIGINSLSNGGFPVPFTNTTENTIGSAAIFGINYQYLWGDGSSSGAPAGGGGQADTGNTIIHTFSLTPSEQLAGIAKTFSADLRVLSQHTLSPFISPNVIVTVEPEVRSIFTGVATVISDRTGDNAQDLYDGIDLFGRDRSVGIFTNTSHNASDYVYSWGDGTSNDIIPDNVSTGSTVIPIYHEFQGSVGNKVVTLTANGTPGTLVQNGRTSNVTMQLNAVPSAPTAITNANLTLSSASQGTSPYLCGGAIRNEFGSGITTGAPVTRYATTTSVTTNYLNDINGSYTGSLSARLNGSGIGTNTFSLSTGESGTFNDLQVLSEGDAHDEISASTYPTGFYQVFTARIVKLLSQIPTGLNDFDLNHSVFGSCGLTTFVKDDLNTTPTLTAGTLTESSGGTKKYISGIPYYDSGGPTLSLSDVQVSNFTGQTYQNTTTPVNIDVDTNYESTTGNIISATRNYTYSQVNGSTSFIDPIYNVPLANTGVGVAYTFGTLSIPLTTSSIRSVQTLRIRARNSAGTGSYATNSTKVQVHTATQSGINEIAIAVADALGNGVYTDDGKRIFDFSAETTNTPSFNGSTNFYTNNPYTESSDPGVQGTKESTIRLGILKHDTTNYSTGFLPVGPNRSGDTGTQYFTFAFRRQVVANFDINITSSTGVSGVWIAAPGTQIDSTSGLNGWLRADTAFAGSGVPGSGVGGNGSDGCASNSGDRILPSTALSGGYTMTLGSENMSNATGNVVLVRIALSSGQSITNLSVGVAA
jgi:hypothetical protein